jgi:hypothetical protein
MNTPNGQYRAGGRGKARRHQRARGAVPPPLPGRVCPPHVGNMIISSGNDDYITKQLYIVAWKLSIGAMLLDCMSCVWTESQCWNCRGDGGLTLGNFWIPSVVTDP